jgi:hypothetical protein
VVEVDCAPAIVRNYDEHRYDTRHERVEVRIRRVALFLPARIEVKVVCQGPVLVVEADLVGKELLANNCIRHQEQKEDHREVTDLAQRVVYRNQQVVETFPNLGELEHTQQAEHSESSDGLQATGLLAEFYVGKQEIDRTDKNDKEVELVERVGKVQLDTVSKHFYEHFGDED